MQYMYRAILTALFVSTSIIALWGQSTQGNSPYSRYGIGDLYSGSFTENASMSGALAPTYRSYWDYDALNPASLGKLRFTAFHAGIFYQHNRLSEAATGYTATANSGNLSSLSLAFPITKSWEVLKDTLRREIPIQWGMAFNLMPVSTTQYNVSVYRPVEGLDDVSFKYNGSGTHYRVNWSNGVTYKGFSAGATMGLMFGKSKFEEFVDLQDMQYPNAYGLKRLDSERSTAFAWDLGMQYEHVLEATSTTEAPKFSDLEDKTKITFGAYVGGYAAGKTFSNSVQLRALDSTLRLSDTLYAETNIENTLSMPLKFGGGVSYGKNLGFQVGLSYEGQLWSGFKRNDVTDPYLRDAHRVALGLQWIPNFSDYNSYFKRVRYRFGMHGGQDYRALTATDGTVYRLFNAGVSMGLGLPMRPPKSKSIVGFTNIALELGYLGHPELIRDYYMRLRLSFNMNDRGWFSQSKFR